MNLGIERISILFISAQIFSTSVFAATKPSSLLIRQKDEVAAESFSSASKAAVQKIDFNSNDEKTDFLNNLDSNRYEVEPVVQFRANDLTLSQQIQQTLLTDPLSANQWSFFSSNTDGNRFEGADTDVLRAWQITKGSEHVMIYFWDTGIEMDASGQPVNPDLKGRVTSYYDALNPGQRPVDLNSHGTHVVSIATSKGENNFGMAGIVPGAVKVGIGRFLGADASGDSSKAAILADWMENDMIIQRQKDPNVKFIWNNSWGGGYSKFLEDKVKRFAAYDVLPITSAGNDHLNVDANAFYPCRFQINANTCVAASDANDVRASFSSYGANSVHLFAPGVRIYGTVPGIVSGSNYIPQNQYKDGTSQAVPHVSGIAALVWAANPQLTANDVRQVLVQSVDKIPSAAGQVFSGGRVNAYRAVLMATGQDPSLANRNLASSIENSVSGGCTMQITDTTAPGGAFWLGLFGLLAALLAMRSSQLFNQKLKKSFAFTTVGKTSTMHKIRRLRKTHRK
ncbi:MAG: S8 family serine peptidase [Deltaproteobacteria bacterium]|nr:S8 family serine peptidase [Deltaproteobacteria bacterium]